MLPKIGWIFSVVAWWTDYLRVMVVVESLAISIWDSPVITSWNINKFFLNILLNRIKYSCEKHGMILAT